MKTWFDEVSKPKEEKDPSFVSTFKFEHQTPKTRIKTVYKTDHPQEPPPKKPYQPKKTVCFGSNKDTERTTPRWTRRDSSDEAMK